MKWLLLLTAAGIIALTGCGNNDKNTGGNKTETTQPEMTAQDEAGKLDLFDFPNTKLNAEPGQMAFAPDASDFKRMRDTAEVSFKGTFSYGIRKLVEVGEYVSTLEDFDEHTIPNSYIIPIPEDTEVKKGDLVLASRYGNSIEFGYVRDASNRSDIKVNFIEIMPYGSNTAVLKDASYIVLTDLWQPGTYICVRSHGLKPARIIKIADDKILARVSSGKIQVFDKEVCVPVPPVMNVTTGDEVYALWSMAKFKKCTVKRVDYELGLYSVEFDDFAGEQIVPFGMVVKEIL